MSPFLTYAEVVPSKPAKDIITLLQQHLLIMSQEHQPNESPMKRQRLEEGCQPGSHIQQSDITSLKKNKQLLIGAESVSKKLTDSMIVFIFNIPETEATTKHLISICR